MEGSRAEGQQHLTFCTITGLPFALLLLLDTEFWGLTLPMKRGQVPQPFLCHFLWTCWPVSAAELYLSCTSTCYIFAETLMLLSFATLSSSWAFAFLIASLYTEAVPLHSSLEICPLLHCSSAPFLIWALLVAWCLSNWFLFMSAPFPA